MNMNKLLLHLAKVNQKAESWPDWKKGILNSKVSNVDEEKERGITIKPFVYNNEDLKTLELGDNNSDVIQNHKLKFLKEVDLAIKEYFMYKYNCDVDELLRISKNVNNFKINERFHKVSTPLQDYYCDGEYCYLTTVQSCAGDLLVKHWLEANCD